MAATIDTIRDDFAFLDEWEDRYRYVIDLGRDLPEFPASERTGANKVQGCVSQVWLKTSTAAGEDPVLTFAADSDAHIVRGLVAIVLALYSGRSASEILSTDAEETFQALGLYEHLTPQRANGIRSMVARIRHEANTALSDAA
jgi:cysteine desulfuration protein SufE